MRQTQSVQKTYQKKSQVEHVLLRPEMYIGPVSPVTESMWILSECETRFINKKIEYCPGLYKIFDEILVNAADNFQRDHRMKKIEVTIDKLRGISVLNDGETIPIAIHKEHNIYVAQLIFGHLLTGSNYEDEEKKVTGGRNGYGAKLANIFSTKFEVETGDAAHEKQLKIKWMDNMSKMEEPTIKKVEHIDNYTKITFVPDFKKFGFKEINSDMMQLMKKRVYDLAGTMKVRVYLNGHLIKIKSFEDYVSYYELEKQSLITLQSSKRWKILLFCEATQFQQMSFVNSICTYRGGSHINHIMDQIVEKTIETIKKKVKNIEVKPAQVKGAFFLFVNCLIQNPVFDSQTKDNLISKPNSYGSEFVLEDKGFKQILKTGVVDKIISLVRSKQNQRLTKQLKKKKGDRLIIQKLEDANLAGTKQHCTLILTEGDSAKALAICGLSIVGRDRYGVFPLRGKILNVRDMSAKQIADSQQLKKIIQIIGLQFNKQYTSTSQLRYQTVMIMADQDNDGSHIKGLVLNFFATFWPSLCRQQGFLKQFITPILKCKRGDQTLSFFSQADYEKWKRNDGAAGWKIKYYKGLGTSTAQQAREYFSNLNKHVMDFNFEEKCFDALDVAFNKKLAHLRKQWISGFDSSNIIDYSKRRLSVTNFINFELINFSMADNMRSIPSMMDGLKPSQRKILYSCFKRNLKNEIKVAQLSGYVAEHSCYHHGQMSLNMTIIGMAQNYVGSNNFNLLMPNGQFGSRNEGGKDSASSRYIFTQLNPLTRLLFLEVDDHIVDYIEEENQMIEPNFYYPILPLVLINGSEGIGMGWSTMIPPFKVRDVIKMMRARINGQTFVPLIGWENFKGTVEEISKDKYLVKGVYEQDENVVTVSQLPPKKWVNDYKKFLLQKLQTSENKEQAEIEDLKEYHTMTDINFVITFIPDRYPADVQKNLKLSTTFQNTNMVLFDSGLKLKKYESVQDVVDQFYAMRIKAYGIRKKYLMSKIKRQMQITESKLRFVQEIIEGKLNFKCTKQQCITNLKKERFKTFDEFPKILSTKLSQQEDENTDSNDYNYLLNLPIWFLTKDKISQLQQQIQAYDLQLRHCYSMSEKDMWLEDIRQFELAWNEANPHQKERESPLQKKNRNTRKKKPSPTENIKQSAVDADSEESVVIKRTRRNERTTRVEVFSMKFDEDDDDELIEVTHIQQKCTKCQHENKRMSLVDEVMEVEEPPRPQIVERVHPTIRNSPIMIEEMPAPVQLLVDVSDRQPQMIVFDEIPASSLPNSFLDRLFNKYLSPHQGTPKPNPSPRKKEIIEVSEEEDKKKHKR